MLPCSQYSNIVYKVFYNNHASLLKWKKGCVWILISIRLFLFLLGKSLLQIMLEKHRGNSSHTQKCIYWRHINDNIFPWTFFMVSQSITQVQGGGSSVPTQDMNKEQYCSNKTTVAPTLFSTHSAGETSIDDISSQKATSTPQNWAGKLPVLPFHLLITFH